ncbi:hypothetical protein IMSAG249_00743 [Lachnospiraceae bacterium]|nr:hypothetical protein IMSAG249_00743 [Lachnospiraceae bacterium]
MKHKKLKWKLLAPGGLILAALLLNITGRIWQGFSDFYVNHVFPIWVETYGRVTGLFSFSVGEWMLYLAVVLTFLLAAGGMIYGIFKKKLRPSFLKACRRYALFYYWVFGIVCVIMTLNCFLLYQASPITERYRIGEGEKEAYGLEEIAALRDHVVEQANRLAPLFERDARGYLIYEGDLEEEAKAQMQRLGETFDNLKGYYPSPKPLFLSGFYSQQYIMGYYFPFSMEANFNRQMYITNMPVTMCHELSHLKGFILEDEANFIGYLACVDSSDLLFEYSAYLSVIGYLDRDFIKAIGEDRDVYLAHPQISQQVALDRKFLTQEAWDAVEKKAVLRTETVKQAADTFLDTTLTLNGVQDGTISYSRVVKLLLKYYDGILY